LSVSYKGERSSGLQQKLDSLEAEDYLELVGGENAPREYGSSGGRALRMVCKPSLDWEA